MASFSKFSLSLGDYLFDIGISTSIFKDSFFTFYESLDGFSKSPSLHEFSVG